MMKNAIWQLAKPLALTAVFAALLPLTTNAQDEIEKAEKTSADKLEKAYAIKASKLSRTDAAKLKEVQAEVASLPGASFKVGATDALTRKPSELLGFDASQLKNMTKEGAEASEKEALQNIKANEKEMKASRSSSAPQLNSDGAPSVGAPVSFLYTATAIRNQGGCGSCWAFGTAAAWEHSYKYFYGGIRDMSEQELLACGKNCAGNTDAGSCGGGWPSPAFEHIYCRRTPTEAAYPYNIAQANTCIVKPKSYGIYHWGYLYMPSATALKDKLVQYGAVEIAMKAGINSFYSYAGGIYNGYPNNGLGNVDHAVLLIGYNDIGQYWIIKNSWGTGWGVSGYAYIKYGHCNIGGYGWYCYPKP